MSLSVLCGHELVRVTTDVHVVVLDPVLLPETPPNMVTLHSVSVTDFARSAALFHKNEGTHYWCTRPATFNGHFVALFHFPAFPAVSSVITTRWCMLQTFTAYFPSSLVSVMHNRVGLSVQACGRLSAQVFLYIIIYILFHGHAESARVSLSLAAKRALLFLGHAERALVSLFLVAKRALLFRALVSFSFW